jgi:hypothetical protein
VQKKNLKKHDFFRLTRPSGGKKKNQPGEKSLHDFSSLDPSGLEKKKTCISNNNLASVLLVAFLETFHARGEDNICRKSRRCQLQLLPLEK